MKWTIAIAIASVLVVPLAGSGSAASAAASRSCGKVAFTPNSDDLATDIRATGLTCGLARDFVADSEGRPGRRFRGFRCSRRLVESEQMPYSSYRCTGAGDVIRWRRY